MGILIDKVRIKNFRALQNVEVELKPITILVGANNCGKTTFLRAINAVLGTSRNFLNKDDLFIDTAGNVSTQIITIDIRVIPINDLGEKEDTFDEMWLGTFAPENISNDGNYDYFAFRSEYNFDNEDSPNLPAYSLISDWNSETVSGEFNRISKIRESLRMFFIEAQRDLLDDLKLRTSYFGKLVSQIEHEYDAKSLKELKELINLINEKAIDKSEVLKGLTNNLSQLFKTIHSKGEDVVISPFPMQLRDMHKGMNIHFKDAGSDAFSMEYHGMGTRSWASILTFGAFIDWNLNQIQKKLEKGLDVNLLFPILALEEPEAHLHPNAHRTLYSQLKGFKGQKIISTHSPYIAGQAELEELRHFYKTNDTSIISQIYFSDYEDEQITKLLAQIESEGKTTEIYKSNFPKITKLKESKKSKLSREEGRKIKREVMSGNGELLFSRAIVLFEGDTEELALPIFAKSYFGAYPFELGLNFIGVGGKMSYKPFLLISKFLKIPCFIFSDGDGTTQTEVENQIIDVFGDKSKIDLIVLDNNAAFEKYLINSGFEEELVKGIDKIESQENYLIDNYIPRLNGQTKKGAIPRNYSPPDGFKSALLDCLTESKTSYAEAIAEQIVEKKNEFGETILPPKVFELFKKISNSIEIQKYITKKAEEDTLPVNNAFESEELCQKKI